MVKIVFVFCFAFLFQSRISDKDFDPKVELEWNEFYEISWENFKGNPDVNSKADAATSVAILAKPYISGKKINYTVYALFNQNKSWARNTNDRLLEHEKLHFDIAELYARKIRKKVAQLQKSNETEIGTYKKAVHQLLEESNQADLKYDLETLHGALKQKQEKWAAQLEKELVELEEFKRKR